MRQLPGLFRIGDVPELNFRTLLLLIVLQADHEHVAQQLNSAGMPQRRRLSVGRKCQHVKDAAMIRGSVGKLDNKQIGQPSANRATGIPTSRFPATSRRS